MNLHLIIIERVDINNPIFRITFLGSHALELFETYQLIFWAIECGYRQQALDVMEGNKNSVKLCIF